MPIIAVCTTKGGAGKTTTAYNLIPELKPDHVIDLDLNSGLQVLSSLRDTPYPYELRRYVDRAELIDDLITYNEREETTLIDCGGFDSDLTRTAIAVADLIICPGNDTPTERIGLGNFNQVLEEISKTTGQDIKAHMLLCKVHPSRKHFPKLDADLKHTPRITRFKSVISSRPEHYLSHEQGYGVTERIGTKHTPAGKEIAAVAAEVRKLLGLVA